MSNIDKEIEAIKAVLGALEPLEPEVRVSVLDYAIKRLQVDLQLAEKRDVSRMLAPDAERSIGELGGAEEAHTKPMHIRQLKELKKPRSANEMAALVAYYLGNEVVEADRKDTITADDLETYFKIAEFRLPAKARFTLKNARSAGYLDAVGGGEYKLNAVGHNLVVHSMPRGAPIKTPRKRKIATMLPAKRKKKPRAAAKKK